MAKQSCTVSTDWLCTSCKLENPPDVISCKICGKVRSDNHQGPLSLSSQQQIPIRKQSTLSVSSAPFIPSNGLSQQQQQTDKKACAAPSDTFTATALPKTPPHQGTDKKTLSPSSPPFDPSWRQRMRGSPAIASPGPTSTSTSRLTTPQDSYSARGDVMAMMPGVYHGSMDTMQSNGMMPPPMFMPGYDMPMMGIPGQVYPTELNEQSLPLS